MPSSQQVISTPLTKLFQINHPVMLAGSKHVSVPRSHNSLGYTDRHECRRGPEASGRCHELWYLVLVDWLSHSVYLFWVPPPGGIGVIGGVRQSPKFLQGSINEIKANLENKDAPFGVDLLLPQLGGHARKTNVSALRACFPQRY
jgi:hypothetical protein